MNKRRKIGLILLGVGLVKIILLRKIVTGGVVGVSYGSLLSLAGTFLFVFGIVLVLIGKDIKVEKNIEKQFEEQVKNISG